MTSTQGLISLFTQHAITFLVATRLERLLVATSLGEIHNNSVYLDYFSLLISMYLSHALYPRYGPVGPRDSERGIKGIHVRMQEPVDDLELVPAVVLVHTAQPALERGRLFSRETQYLAETIIPIDATSAVIPHPAARS